MITLQPECLMCSVKSPEVPLWRDIVFSRRRATPVLSLHRLWFPIRIAFRGSTGKIKIHIRQRTAPDENSPHGLYFHHPSAIQAFEGTPEVTEGLMIHIHVLTAPKALYFHRLSFLPRFLTSAPLIWGRSSAGFAPISTGRWSEAFTRS